MSAGWLISCEVRRRRERVRLRQEMLWLRAGKERVVRSQEGSDPPVIRGDR
jgi:hypothetical protein